MIERTPNVVSRNVNVSCRHPDKKIWAFPDNADDIVRATTILRSHIFSLNDQCFEKAHVEKPSDRQLSLADNGNPIQITLSDITTNGSHRWSISQSGRNSMTTPCTSDDFSTFREGLCSCRYSVTMDGSCFKLTEETVEDILRLYDAYNAPLPSRF